MVDATKDDVSSNVIGRGKVVCLINNIRKIFKGVLHISELSSNLLHPEKLTSVRLCVNLGA